MERNNSQPRGSSRRNYQNEIVADDCSVAVSRRTIASPLHSISPVPYNRCDSGFNSGPEQFQQKGEAIQTQTPEKSNIPYNRLDSGFCSQFNSLSVLETQDTRIGGSQSLQKPTYTNEYTQQESEAHSYEFIEELFEQDAEGDTQLHLAIASNYEDVVNALVRLAPKPEYLNIQNDELYAPLHIAVLTNQPNMVRKLVVAGATTQIVDQEGNTPLHHACSRGYYQCAEQLLKPISRDEVHHDSSLTLEQNHLHQVIDHTNHKGEHCLHLATFGKHHEIIRFLCFKGANMNATEGRSGKTALHYAVNMRDNDLVGLLAGPKSRGCCQIDLDTKDWAGRTPIQCALINGDDYIVAILASLGADTTPSMESDDNEDADDDFENCSYPDIEVTTSRFLETQA